MQQRAQLQELLDWEPAGHKYVYNDESGMIHTTGALVHAFLYTLIHTHRQSKAEFNSHLYLSGQ